MEVASLVQTRAFKLFAGTALAHLGLKALSKLSARLSQAKLNNFVADTYDWPHEIVVVTGGSGGIGTPLVRKFAALGSKVIILDIAPPHKDTTQDGANNNDNNNVHFYKVDLSSHEETQRVAARLRSEHGDPTVLINNAGIASTPCVHDADIDVVARTFAVNIVSHFALVREFLPAMVARDHGHVVAVASMRSFVSGARAPDYAASKAGLVSFMEGLAQEVRHLHRALRIRTSIVHPSWVRTPMTDNPLVQVQGRAMLDAEEVADQIFKHVVAGKSGRLLMPAKLWFLPALRAFPMWLQEMLRDTQARGMSSEETPGTGAGAETKSEQ